jgi:5'-3' exonuclease
MGIPSYFNFILNNHAKIIRKKSQIRSDYLFVDANSLIYDCINEFQDEVPQDNTIIFKQVYENINKLINDVNPQNKTYLCFDGVPPYAKMNQQRQRRFKGSLTNKILNKSCDSWNRNQITPGTTFMNDLDKYLTSKFYQQKSVVFSPSSEHNEGEHKISNIIKSNPAFKKHNLIIYGLDADLFMLGLLLVYRNFKIFLYKETHHFSYISKINRKEKYYFDIESFSHELGDKLKVNIDQAICDYCLMAFLCGNDFLPHLHSINIRNAGIPFIINNYLKLDGSQYPLIDVNTGNINWNNFRKFSSLLCEEEKENILANLKWKLCQKRKKQPLNPSDKLEMLPCFDTEKEEYLYENIDDFRDFVFENIEMKELCYNYLEMIQWTWYYYYHNNVIDNTKCYLYGEAPLLSDLLRYIPLFNNETFLKLHKSEPINETTLLLYVLPYEEHSQIIPSNIYKEISESVYDEMPLLKEINYNIHYLLCKYFWESHLELVHIDVFKLNHIVLHRANIELN